VSVTIKDNTKQVLSSLQDKALQFVTGGGLIIQTEMKVLTPVKTGNLRNSEQSVAYVEDGVPVSETGPTAEYAEDVEFGTFRQRAKPYAEPGFQNAIPKINRYGDRVLKI